MISDGCCGYIDLWIILTFGKNECNKYTSIIINAKSYPIYQSIPFKTSLIKITSICKYMILYNYNDI